MFAPRITCEWPRASGVAYAWHREMYSDGKIPPRSLVGAATTEDTPHWLEMLSLGLGPFVETTALVGK